MPSEQRLHPLSMLFAFGKSLKAFALPGLVVLFTTSRRPGSDAEAWLMLLLIPSAAVSIARYLSFRLRYEGAELVIRSGIIFRNERHIPYARIQNLDAVQNVFHRLLGVIEVRVETGAGAEPEATISVLPAAALDDMRRRVFSRQESAPSAAPVAGRTVVRMPLGELLLHGFLENRGMVVIGALYGLLWELGLLGALWSPVFGDDVDGEGLVREVLATLVSGRRLSAVQVALAAAGVAGFLIVVRIVSMCWAAVRLYGFHLTRVGQDLRTEFGLLTRVTATIPLRRIQSMTIREGPLYRLAGRVSVRVETAGGRTSEDGAPSAREWLAPLMRPADLPAVIAEALPDLAEGFGHEAADLFRAAGREQEPRPLFHPRAFRRAITPRLSFAVMVSALSAAALGWPALIVAALVLPWSIYAARRYVDHLWWTATDDVVVFRSGWVWRAVTVARVSKIQAVTLVETPFDRRTGMARVRVDTAGASERSHRVDIPYLARGLADDLQLRLAAQAAGTAFRW
jgi:putative membrane protein